MAYVVRRPGGRWEIRESYTSPAGPRSRTLATFRVLSPQVIERAVHRARKPVAADTLLRAARRAGAPFESANADDLAKSLIRTLARGETIRPGLRRLLIEGLTTPPSSVDALADWVGASLQERGSALVQLLNLTDSLSKSRNTPLRFPGLSPSRLKG